MLAKEFKDWVNGVPDDAELTFGVLAFNRIKKRGANLYDVEFSPLVTFDPQSREWGLIATADEPPTNA